MKGRLLAVCGMAVSVVTMSSATAQTVGTPESGVMRLSAPAKTGGLPVMAALSARASAREWAERPLGPQDLSDLLWAANGVNRPDGRRTASSATNAQDVDIYVFDRAGVYLYDATAHALRRIADGDHRTEILMLPPAGAPPAPPPGAPAPPPGPRPTPTQAPVQLVLISDLSRFRVGTPEQRAEWGAIDTGLVAQNVMLFCAGRGLATRPRGSFDREVLTRLLKLKDTQRPFLNLPVGYPVSAAPSSSADATTNPNVAVALGDLETVWTQGEPVDGYAKYVDLSRYLHHPGTPGGADPERLAAFRASYPDFRYDVKRVFVHGDYVITHSLVTGVPGLGTEVRSPQPGMSGRPKVADEVVDIFLIKNGKIVEHWDVVEAVGGSTDGLF